MNKWINNKKRNGEKRESKSQSLLLINDSMFLDIRY
jgi:hypothetical protein